MSSALSEGLGLDRLNRDGFDAVGFFQKLISGDDLTSLLRPEAVLSNMRNSFREALSELLSSLALPVAVCVLLRLVISGSGTDFMMNLLCALCCGTALIQTWISAQQQVAALIDGLLQATDAMTPVLASAAAMTGGGVWASAVVPLSSLCAAFVQRALRDWGVRLCACAAVIALAGGIAGRYALNRLFALLKGVARWMLSVAVFIYGALIAAQGIVSAAKDGAAVQTAKIAIESIVPIIGGGVADATGALTISAGLARGAVGLTGVMLIAKLCLTPMLALGRRTLALKLTAAAMEPLAEGAAVQLIAQFGDILETLLAIAICAAVLTAMLPAGCALTVGGLLR